MNRKPENPSIRGHPLADIVQDIARSKEKPGTCNFAGKLLWEAVPQLTVAASYALAAEVGGEPPETDPGIFLSRMKNTRVVTVASLAEAIKSVSRWEEFDESKSQALLRETLPRLLALIPLSRKENNEPSINALFSRLASQTGSGELEIILPACPTYDYMVDSKTGQLRHASGQLLPTVGDRFVPVAKTLQAAVKPLADAGVTVRQTFITYDGSDPERLVELGADVTSHYVDRENEMLGIIQSAFNDLSDKINVAYGQGPIRGEAKSIEKEIALGINEKVEDFKTRFRVRRNPHSEPAFSVNPENQAMHKWMMENFDGCGVGLLMLFMEQEVAYEERQRIEQAGDKVVLSALKEALVYHGFRQMTHESGGIIIDPETTEDYMNGPFRHYSHNSTPVAVLKPFNPAAPLDPLKGARQPFNLPKGLDEYRRNKNQ